MTEAKDIEVEIKRFWLNFLKPLVALKVKEESAFSKI